MKNWAFLEGDMDDSLELKRMLMAQIEHGYLLVLLADHVV